MPARLTPRRAGTATIARRPSRATSSSEPARLRGPRSSASNPSSMQSPARVNTASVSTAPSGDQPAAIAPASSGPTIVARFRLVASSAFADASSSSSTRTGITLVKPPKESGQVRPRSTETTRITPSGRCPVASARNTRTTDARDWSSTMSARRRPRRSSHAPSSGAVTRLGSVTAATTPPASVALPVRSSTSSTMPTENISSAVRASVAAVKNRR